MNIFVLSEKPRECAELLHDKHLVKMVLETTQLLCTTQRVLLSCDEVCDRVGLYKATHVNHPCAVWVRSTQCNYAWTYSLYVHLLAEYHRRYYRLHKCSTLRYPLSVNPLSTGKLTPWPLCMPDKYKQEGDAVSSYIAYYKGEKILATSRWNKSSTIPEALR